MSKQYIIIKNCGFSGIYYSGLRSFYTSNWIYGSVKDVSKNVTVFDDLHSAERVLLDIRNNAELVDNSANKYSIYEYQPEQVIPAKVGNLVNTEKENVLNCLHFVEVTLHSHSPYCCELIKKAMNYIKENT